MNQRMKKTSQFPPFLQKVGKLLAAQAGQAPQFMMFTERLIDWGQTGYSGHHSTEPWALGKCAV